MDGIAGIEHRLLHPLDRAPAGLQLQRIDRLTLGLSPLKRKFFVGKTQCIGAGARYCGPAGRIADIAGLSEADQKGRPLLVGPARHFPSPKASTDARKRKARRGGCRAGAIRTMGFFCQMFPCVSIGKFMFCSG